ncbi:MAG: S8 family serine peptidase [Terriglobales bacterium]
MRFAPLSLILTGCLAITAAAQTTATPQNDGVLTHLSASVVASFDAQHNVQSLQLNPNRDLYLITASDGRTDQQLLDEIATDPNAGRPVLNAVVGLSTSQLDQSTASVLNGGQSTASVLNGGGGTGTTDSVSSGGGGLLGGLLGGVLGGVLSPVVNLLGGILNPLLGQVLNLNIGISGTGTSIDSGSTNLLRSSPSTYYGAVVPDYYASQPTVNQIYAGSSAHRLSTGQGAVVALIGNGVDPSNPVLTPVLLATRGWNFYDNTPDWSAYADLAAGPSAGPDALSQSTASVLNGGQSTASVLNSPTCQQQFGGSGLNQSTASVLNGGQSTASVLNGGQSTASVLNGAQSTSAALAAINQILACDPDFGHGTEVAGLIHLVAPRAMILPIKAFGPGGTADVASIYASITYAIDQHVNVLNLSFSATSTTPDIQDAIHEAVGDGIVVVASAGNDGASAPVFPAAFAGVLGTGAVDGTTSTYALAAFSNFDPGVGQIVDAAVAAPGVQLFTTYPGGGQIWATVSGTSFSAPLVTGEAALLYQLHQSGSAARGTIESATNPSISGDARGGLGRGLINITQALQSAAPRLRLWW